MTTRRSCQPSARTDEPSFRHPHAAGNPQAYVQLKAGHSQGTITERYIHVAQVLFPGAAAKGWTRMFGTSA